MRKTAKIRCHTQQPLREATARFAEDEKSHGPCEPNSMLHHFDGILRLGHCCDAADHTDRVRIV